MDILNKKINGFTLVEAMISMIIIMTCFAMSSMIYINILHSDNKREKAIAFIEVNRIATESLSKSQYTNQIFDVKGLTIERKIESYKSDDILKTFIVTAYNEKKRNLYSYKQIIIPWRK